MTGLEPVSRLFYTAETADVAKALAPDGFLGIGFDGLEAPWGPPEKPGHDTLGIPRLSTEVGSKVEILSKLILPYGLPSRGFIDNEDFASIHSSPPWETTPFPGAVQNAYGPVRHSTGSN